LIEVVIFDLDGTLINLPIDYEKLFRRFAKIMNIEDVRPVTEKVARLDEETRKKVFKVWDKAELEALKDVTVIDEGMRVYNEYHAKPTALVTMQGKALVKQVLAALETHFAYIVTREDSLDRVEQLSLAAKKLNVPFQNMMFIGNTVGDALAARKVKCQFLRAGK
jgi:HAD superfamily hydrolase (TIGR01549 family)